jgi:starch synthase
LKKRLRINIAAAHRFHLLDLARELETHGHEVRFYSYVPTKRALKFGLKKENSYSFFYIMMPFLALWKISKGSAWSTKLLHRLMDYYLTFFMKPCDVYIALGTIYYKSFFSAKNKFNAITILEWGSKHIISQEKAILVDHKVRRRDPFFFKRSIAGYSIADYISIPTKHVETSFIENGVDQNKLIINPYGVDLNMFSSTELTSEKNHDLIMVGTWSYTKGCDLITDFLETYNYSFLHVGALKDLAFPAHKNMQHIDPVDQADLIKYYSQARVFLLPSRAEGLAMVQAQALACGLPIVCSKDTGGHDLRELLYDKEWIIEMKDFSLSALQESVDKALVLAERQKGKRNYAGNSLENLTWTAYGERYNSMIKQLCHVS